MKKIAGVIAIVAAVCMSSVSAKAGDVAVTSGVDFYSAYVWRGMTFNDGFVAQPNINIAKSGVNLNVWGNVDLSDYDGALESGEMSEVDVTLNYGFSLGKVSTTVGYIEYLYPTTESGGIPGTREVYLSLGLPLFAGLSTALDTYYDFDELEEYYSKLSFSYGLGINDKTTLTAGASAAYAGDAYCGDGEAGFYDYTLSLKLGYAANDNWSISCGLTFVDAIDSDNLMDVKNGGLHDVSTWGGISIGYTF
jgi:hypothetical protein